MLFTLFIDYAGGTFISQSRNEFPESGFVSCIENWNTSSLSNIISDSEKQTIIHDIRSETAIPIAGMINVWCMTLSLGDSPMLLHLVAMDDN